MFSRRFLPRHFPVLALLLLILIQGCGEDLQRKHYKSSPSDNPHDTDSVYVLARRMLRDENPRAAFEALMCQNHLLTQRLGSDEAERRIAIAVDTALRNRGEEKRWASLQGKLSGFYGDADALCARTAARASGDTTHMPGPE